MMELAEPLMGIAPMVVAALIGLAGTAAKASADSATKAPGVDSVMKFGDEDGKTISETFKKQDQNMSPWMSNIVGQAPQQQYGLGLQQTSGTTMQEQFG